MDKWSSNRVLVWVMQPIAYCAFWICTFQFGGGGHGSYFPLAAFWGWTVTLLELLQPAALVAGWPVFLLSGLQMTVYALLWMLLESRRLGWKAGLLLPGFHLLGTALYAQLRPLEELRLLDQPFGSLILAGAWIFASSLLIGYWTVLLLLLAKNPATKG